uniref:Uncharacterized protein n=1 Tax=Oryza meridionalis TaxID=40149 RepID=A0A0E0EQD1_9ORYZ
MQHWWRRSGELGAGLGNGGDDDDGDKGGALATSTTTVTTKGLVDNNGVQWTATSGSGGVVLGAVGSRADPAPRAQEAPQRRSSRCRRAGCPCFASAPPRPPIHLLSTLVSKLGSRMARSGRIKVETTRSGSV